MFSCPKILFLVSLLFVALLNSIPTYVPFEFFILVYIYLTIYLKNFAWADQRAKVYFIYYIKLKSRPSVPTFWRSVSRPSLHGSTSDMLNVIAMSSGMTKFIFKSF